MISQGSGSPNEGFLFELQHKRFKDLDFYLVFGGTGMARILYAVCGVGLGHAGRSKTIINELKKKHTVKIVSHEEGLELLKKNFNDIESIEWFRFVFKENKVDKYRTIIENTPKALKVFSNNFRKLGKIIREFRPDIIISDFEFNALHIGRMFNIPVILISNMHVMQYHKVELSVIDKASVMLFEENMLRAFSGAEYYFILTLLDVKDPSRKNFLFFPPIVRSEFINVKIEDNDYFLVYIDKQHLPNFISIAKGNFPEKKFIIYGLGKNSTDRNITFRDFSDGKWIEDIKGCKAVMCHGGMSTISEAVILRKPIYIVPTPGWFERYHNASIVEKLDFGIMEEKPSEEGMKKFFANLETYKKSLLKSGINPSNKEFIGKLEEAISKLTTKKFAK